MSDETHDPSIADYFYADVVMPEQMDLLWADGWRHFGADFFRTTLDLLDDVFTGIMPLRIVVPEFRLSKSQRRVLRKNTDVSVKWERFTIQPEVEALFERHKQRFSDNTPESLETFFPGYPELLPCTTLQCSVYKAGELLAVSYVDIGSEALSSVYAMFEPREARRSLGIFTLLQELLLAAQLGRRYVYLGYAHHTETSASCYAYKKQFSGLEWYNWSGEWIKL